MNALEEIDDDLDIEVDIEVEKTEVDVFKETYKSEKYMVIGRIREDGTRYEIGEPWKPSKVVPKGKKSPIDRTKEFVVNKLIKKVR